MVYDVTGAVPLDDPRAVASAIEAVFVRRYGGGAFDRTLLHAAFAHVGRLYRGEHADFLRCDMPYHDLRHALDAALATARLVDGQHASGAVNGSALPAELGLVAVLLALLHDTGFLRTRAETTLRGPQLATTHEIRSIRVATGYLATTSCARYADLAALILATRVALPPATVLDGRSDPEVAIGRMLGSADLLCQVADRHYLERCFHHLYPELVLGGGDRHTTVEGREELLFRDARDFIARTPAFHANVVMPRLEHGLGDVARYLAAHFDGDDPYAGAMRANMARCSHILDGDRWSLLGGPPPTTTVALDPAYGGTP